MSIIANIYKKLFAPLIHSHTKAEVTDFTHTHLKADVTDFSHNHTKSEISDFTHSHLKTDITDFVHTHSSSSVFMNNSNIVQEVLDGLWVAYADHILGVSDSATQEQHDAFIAKHVSTTDRTNWNAIISHLAEEDNTKQHLSGEEKTRLLSGIGFPDYSNAITDCTQPFTVTVNGYFFVFFQSNGKINVNGVICAATGEANQCGQMIPVSVGDVITWNAHNGSKGTFFPLK